MKREIKFRAFVNGKMLNLGFYIGCQGGAWMWGDTTYTDSKPLDAPIMQFTGLTDSESKDVYEGDIVKYISLTDDDWLIGAVTYRDGSYRLHQTINPNVPVYDAEVRMWNDGCNHWYSIENLDTIEVIGNIYENPELMPA